MSTLQIRNMPKKLHDLLAQKAKKEKRSMSQQALVILENALIQETESKFRRRELIEKIKEYQIDHESLSNPTELLRIDRDQ